VGALGVKNRGDRGLITKVPDVAESCADEWIKTGDETGIRNKKKDNYTVLIQTVNKRTNIRTRTSVAIKRVCGSQNEEPYAGKGTGMAMAGLGFSIG
jgi:hypothetical protein